MDRPKPDFAPGKEPEIVHSQHSIPAPRLAAVSVDTLLIMRDALNQVNHPNVRVALNQLERLIKAAG